MKKILILALVTFFIACSSPESEVTNTDSVTNTPPGFSTDTAGGTEMDPSHSTDSLSGTTRTGPEPDSAR